MSPIGLGAALVLLGSVVVRPPGQARPLHARPPQEIPQTTVNDVLSKMPWDAAKDGPLIAVSALRIATGTTLDALDRRKAVVGGVTAIVPKTMVTVNSRFTTTPNMYDGLPREAKVLYLLRSLTPAQLNKATTDGISIADCKGEQAAVFDSILPNPLRYSMGTVGEENGIQGDPTGKTTTLEGNERAEVKLRIVRHVWLQITLANNGGYTAHELPETEKIGTPMASLEEPGDEEFGQKILVKGPNVPRKSQLDLRDGRLGKMIPLVNGERTKALLERISTATGVRLIADQHYANMQVMERGDSAIARDLLGALSLGVAGTYRRLGDTYILTNDLEGMAAHSARIALWEDSLKKLVDARTNEWRAELARKNGLRRISFDSPFAEGLTTQEQDNLNANDRPNNQTGYLPVGQTNKVIQQTMKTLQNGLDVDRERVGLASNIRYEIVLPKVGRTWWRGWLGNTEEFDPKPYAWAPPNPPVVPLPLEAKTGVAGLALHADTPDQAKRLVTRVSRLGVGELWLETVDPKTLSAAVEAGKASGVKVCLAVRPWALAPGETSADLDRTATMEHGRGLAAQKAGIEPFQNFLADISTFESPSRELIATLDPASESHIARTRDLAATKGLAKVAVLDLYPSGYGKEESNESGSYWYSVPLDAYLAYGYTDAMRQAYLRTEGLDPLDLETQMVHTDVRLGEAWGEVYSFGQGFDKWQKAKGKWSHDRALTLSRALHASDPSLPILVPGEPAHNHLPPPALTYLFRMGGPEELPLGVVDYGGGKMPDSTDVQVMELVDSPDPAQSNRVADRLRKLLAKPSKPLVLDLTSVSSSRLDLLLSRWLK